MTNKIFSSKNINLHSKKMDLDIFGYFLGLMKIILCVYVYAWSLPLNAALDLNTQIRKLQVGMWKYCFQSLTGLTHRHKTCRQEGLTVFTEKNRTRKWTEQFKQCGSRVSCLILQSPSGWNPGPWFLASWWQGLLLAHRCHPQDLAMRPSAARQLLLQSRQEFFSHLLRSLRL